MKRIALFLMIVVLATSVFAAAKKAAPAKTPAPPTVSIPAPAPDPSMRIGALTIAAPGGFGSVPTIGMRINPNMFLDLGLAVGQNAAGANTNLGALIRLENQLFRSGDLKAVIGGNLWYATNPGYAAAATPATTLNIFAGFEYELVKNLSVLANLTLLEATSTGGATQLGLGAGTATGSGLGTVSIAFVNGVRLYY